MDLSVQEELEVRAELDALLEEVLLDDAHLYLSELLDKLEQTCSDLPPCGSVGNTCEERENQRGYRHELVEQLRPITLHYMTSKRQSQRIVTHARAVLNPQCIDAGSTRQPVLVEQPTRDRSHGGDQRCKKTSDAISKTDNNPHNSLTSGFTRDEHAKWKSWIMHLPAAKESDEVLEDLLISSVLQDLIQECCVPERFMTELVLRIIVPETDDFMELLDYTRAQPARDTWSAQDKQIPDQSSTSAEDQLKKPRTSSLLRPYLIHLKESLVERQERTCYTPLLVQEPGHELSSSWQSSQLTKFPPIADAPGESDSEMTQKKGCQSPDHETIDESRSSLGDSLVNLSQAHVECQEEVVRVRMENIVDKTYQERCTKSTDLTLKLRSPYKVPTISPRVDKPEPLSSPTRQDVCDKGLIPDALQNRKQSSLRRPFRKHVLRPRVLEMSCDLLECHFDETQASLTQQDKEQRDNRGRPRVRQPFKRLTIKKRERSPDPGRIRASFDHDIVMPESVNSSDIPDSKRPCLLSDGEATGLAPMCDPTSTSTTQQEHSSGSPAYQSITHPTLGALANSSRDQMLMTSDDPACWKAEQKDSNTVLAHSDNGIRLQSNRGWATAGGVELRLDRDAALAAEWNAEPSEVPAKHSSTVTRSSLQDSSSEYEDRCDNRLRLTLLAQQSEMQGQIRTLTEDLEAAQFALSIELKHLDTLPNLIAKWRCAAQRACLDVYRFLERRIEDSGGLRALDRSIRACLSKVAMSDESRQNMYQLKSEQEIDCADPERFTMKMMLELFSIPSDLIRLDSDAESWT